MTNDQNSPPKKDWNELAVEALDLWQNHLNSLASDPKVKEDMTRFVTPMTQMFSQWTSMMQTGMQNMADFASTAAAAQEQRAADQGPDESKDEMKGAVDDGESGASDDTRGDAGTVDTAHLADDIDRIIAANAPAAERPVQQQQPAAPQPAARGRAPASDGARDLAQLAGRLAELERELDGLRPKAKRSDDGGAAHTAADGTVQRVAGTD